MKYYDVKVKRYPMALSLVKLHKQPKGLGERPVLGTAASEGRARACPRRLCNLTRRCSLNHLLTSTSYYVTAGKVSSALRRQTGNILLQPCDKKPAGDLLSSRSHFLR